MEPIVNKEGLEVMKDDVKSRSLLNDYYTRLGYTVVSPSHKHNPNNSAAHPQDPTAAHTDKRKP